MWVTLQLLQQPYPWPENIISDGIHLFLISLHGGELITTSVLPGIIFTVHGAIKIASIT
ncbi:TPA: hypothetical protein ACUIRW_004788 [Klebsiella pneumoniae]|uniref:hypothetical protein n=1 Tax=Klebsiella pneumoniae TaxID=573 RepID=UPI00188787DC|nr:hypothetical protein [Klebsiella pneumoniae]MCM6415374.1 hypothetical protein [Klebsiella pneumoniae]MDG0696431.1 hypothetical protein [Klebsiella pneumoniae]MDH8528735.1 hypothetical protein [Klebsiella pneumoniae]MEE2387009.1 hypothetical protein [Klebsiella pneumoniae]